jgi:hypothetical protein
MLIERCELHIMHSLHSVYTKKCVQSGQTHIYPYEMKLNWSKSIMWSSYLVKRTDIQCCSLLKAWYSRMHATSTWHYWFGCCSRHSAQLCQTVRQHSSQLKQCLVYTSGTSCTAQPNISQYGYFNFNFSWNLMSWATVRIHFSCHSSTVYSINPQEFSNSL